MRAKISCVLSNCLPISDQTIFDGLQEQSRLKISNELWRFIEVDNHEAVKIGDLEKNSEAIKVVKPKINMET